METRELPYAGWSVSRLAFDHQVVLLLQGPTMHDHATVVIETQLMLDEAAMSPGPPLTDLTPLLTLFEEEVATMRATEAGDLRMAFASGRVLRVAPDPSYEAWSVLGPVGMLCGPGGGSPWG